jgi:hypothetical protein
MATPAPLGSRLGHRSFLVFPLTVELLPRAHSGPSANFVQGIAVLVANLDGRSSCWAADGTMPGTTTSWRHQRTKPLRARGPIERSSTYRQVKPGTGSLRLCSGVTDSSTFIPETVW